MGAEARAKHPTCRRLSRAPDQFAGAFGEGRGLSAVQAAERERLTRLAAEPRAFSMTDSQGTVTVSYYQHNNLKGAVLHREDGPALIEIRANGQRRESYYHQHRLQRAGGPAVIETFPDGTHIQTFCCEGLIGRADDGPAIIETQADGLQVERYLVAGKPHRADGAAVIETHADGGRVEQFWRDGELIYQGGFPCVTVTAGQARPGGALRTRPL
jgi:hypothetical protein